MLHIFDFAREMTFLGVAFRMVLAAVCGGVIGLEREYKRRPAGFRTHILICLGACTAVLTNLYLYQVLHLFTDVSRLGAQVIAGIGFIGAGTIIVTRRQRVKGLTTAAGLWTSAIIGLTVGAGYVECALFATFMVLVAELLLIKIEYRFARKINDVNLFIEYGHSVSIEDIIGIVKSLKINMTTLEINRISGENDTHRYCAVMGVEISKEKLDQQLIESINQLEDIISIEEI